MSTTSQDLSDITKMALQHSLSAVNHDHAGRIQPEPNPVSSIKVIGAGMPRTGTMSLKVALEKLGYQQCYHMVDLMQNLSGVDDWLRVSKGKKILWDKLLDGYQAIVDIPGQRYYRELMQAYPEAKIILTTRDPSRWYDSVKQTIYHAHTLNEIENHWWWLRYPLSEARKNKVLLGRLIGQIMWDDYFEQRFEDKDFVLSVYEDHIKAVKRYVPADDLLIFDVAEGWQPLCEFLQRPCPQDEAFPHVNDRDHFQKFWQAVDVDAAKTSVATRTLVDKVTQHSAESADSLCLMDHHRSLTYGDLYQQSQQIAHLFSSMGFSIGDRVALFLPNSIEFVSSYLGVHQAGGVIITINTALTSAEVDHILTDSQASFVITTTVLKQQINRHAHASLQKVILVDGPTEHADSLASQLKNLPAEAFQRVAMSADDPAVLLYSSGTTGKPKGAVISHGSLLASARMVAQELALSSDDKILIFLPMFHSYALTCMLGSALYSKASIVILPEFEASQVLRAVAQHQVTVFFAVPTIYTLLGEQAEAESLTSINRYISAGANLPVEIARRWQAKFGMPIMDGLGCTEGSHVTLNRNPVAKPGSVGLPLSGVEIRVVDEMGQSCEADCLGEIALRGPNIMLGYWNQLEQAVHDGWFRTGDIGRYDADGYLYVVDRRKDMVNVSGEKVYPNEVEQVLYRHPAVAEAAIYGVAHTVMGEEVHASIVLKNNQSATAEEIIDFCRKQLAYFKLPGSVEFVESLPKGRTGKILKRVLRERFAKQDNTAQVSKNLQQQLQQSSSSHERTVLLKQQIRADIRQILGCELDDEISVFEAGMDSLMSIQLTNRLSTRLGISLPTTLTLEHESISKLTQHLTALYEANGLAEKSLAEQNSQSDEAIAEEIYQWFPQSYIQQLYYGWHEAAENKAFMNMNFLVRLRSAIHAEHLQAALHWLLQRHPELCLVFDRQQGVPVQKVNRDQSAFFVHQQVDCVSWDEIKDKLFEVSRKPFDLRQDSLMRVYLFSRAADDHLLLIVRHHIMNDRTTAALVTDELFRLYQAKLTASDEREVTTATYFEFLQWHQRMLHGPEGQQHWNYWQQQLNDQPEPLKLPTDFPRKSKNRHYGATYHFEIPAALTASLRQLATQQHVTLYTVMMAAFQLLWHLRTGQRDILVDTSMINRTQQRFEKTLGQLSIIHTIRTRITEEASFTELLQQVQKTVREALQHQNYPSQLLIERLKLPEGYVYNRPGQVLFNLVTANFSHHLLDRLRAYGLAPEPTSIIPSGSSGVFHEINTQFLETEDTLLGHINYETDLYRESTIQRLMQDYLTLLQQLLDRPECSIADLRRDQ